MEQNSEINKVMEIDEGIGDREIVESHIPQLPQMNYEALPPSDNLQDPNLLNSDPNLGSVHI